MSGPSWSDVGFLVMIQIFAKCDIEPIFHRVDAPNEEVTYFFCDNSVLFYVKNRNNAFVYLV